MSILREKREIRLNAVVEAAVEAADHYEEEAERVGEERIALLFADLARRRREMSETLSAHVRRLGDLPFEPDLEAEIVHELASRIRTATEDRRRVLLEERIEAEVDLKMRINAALKTDLPANTLRVLKEYEEDAEAAAAQLSELLAQYASAER
jgi:uncharacterized protein (TIGR02284 family)